MGRLDAHLWSEFNPTELANIKAWRGNRALIWAWYEWRRGLVLQAAPNAGHLAAVALEQRFGAALVTQNVDDLHERAGARQVTHLHGSLFAPRCDTCERPHAHTHAQPVDPLRELEPPECAHCSGRIRPGVVWFGESLPVDALNHAKQAIAAADLLLIVGTSSVVYPAAALVDLAPSDCLLLEINPASVQRRRPSHLVWNATAADALPKLLERLEDVAKRASVATLMAEHRQRHHSTEELPPELDRLISAHPRLFPGGRTACWSELPAGWYGLAHEVCCGIEGQLNDEELEDFEVLQIKQKLGSLRFYFRMGRASPRIAAIADLIEQAREASGVMCEICGARTTHDSSSGRIRPLCEGHGPMAAQASS